MPKKPKSIFFLVPLALVLTAAPGLAQQESVPEPVLSAWSNTWNSTVDELSDDLILKLGEQLPDDKRSAFLDDLSELIDREVGWDAMGKEETERILIDTCGLELLHEATPYFSDSTQTMPAELNKRYVACFGDAQFYVRTTPAYALLKVARDKLPALYERHGIDPRGL